MEVKGSPYEAKYQNVCVHLPPQINSKGAWPWNDKDHNHLKYSLPLLELQIIMAVSFNLLFHFLFKRLGLPKIITHISAGLSIGAILKKLHEKSKSELVLFPLHSQQTLGTLAWFGYMLKLFIIGVKMDMKMILTTGRKAIAVGVVALVAPLIAGLIFASYYIDKGENERESPVFNVAVTQSLTTFPVISCLLSELEIINSELGRLALSSAVISELLSLFLLTVLTSIEFFKPGKEKIDQGVMNLFLLVLFLICAFVIIRPAMFWVIRRTPEGRPVKDSYIMIIIIGVILSATASNQFGQLVLFAPYILGLVMPDGPPLGSALVDKLDTFVSGLLMPLFITTCASRVTFSGFDLKFKKEVLTVVGPSIVTSGAKLIACMLTTSLGSKMPLSDSLALSLSMSAKGIVEMSAYTLLSEKNILDDKTFAVAVITTMVQAGIIPIIVKKLYDPSRKYAGYQKRNINHLSANEELRILVCIHTDDNISSTIKLLDASNPTKESPIAAFVLHLIELVGRTTPVFISHQIQKITNSDQSYSERIIVAFDQYEKSKDNKAISIQSFTSISPPKLMHEDIGTLALNKLASLIIIPFHRKWAMDGSIESENRSMRTLNISVLDRAPCSVGILIDRGRLVRPTSLESSLSSQTTYRVAMIFIGGHDDREALAYAKRMAHGSGISCLTVIRFVSKEGNDYKEWEWMMDDEVLKDVKENKVEDGHVQYREETVVDGPETVMRIREMVNDYELTIVGRRHNVESPQTSGLMEWSEFPELGIIGDLLASPDLESRTSVLVVQQQRMAAKS